MAAQSGWNRTEQERAQPSALRFPRAIRRNAHRLPAISSQVRTRVLTLGFLLTQLLPASETIRAKQGDAIKVKATAPVTQARFGSRTIRLFHQADGSMFG